MKKLNREWNHVRRNGGRLGLRLDGERRRIRGCNNVSRIMDNSSSSRSKITKSKKARICPKAPSEIL